MTGIALESGELERLVADGIGGLAEDLAADVDLLHRGRWVTVDCLVGSPARPWHLGIVEGRIADATPGPVLMRPWSFAFRATPAAWMEFWQPVPKPGFHDLLALTKKGVATVEGDIRVFLANLQYFKDLLALPRRHGAGS